MITDARSIPTGTTLDAEICIVGAGAAGITLAREFANSPLRVVLLESGGMLLEQATQDLYKGQIVGRPLEELTASRLRYFGGTTNHWGGFCLPLDAIDFEPRETMPYHGWPIRRKDLDPWYQRAQTVCQLGPFDYRPASWGITPEETPPPFAGPDFKVKILQQNWLRFGPAYAPELRRASNVSVHLHANAFNFETSDNAAQVETLAVKTLAGNHFSVRARIYVLACGCIENARLLLASGKEGGNGLGNANDLVGRFFMLHLTYPGGLIVPAHPRMTFDFRTDLKYRIDGRKHWFWSFIGLTEETMRRRHLPNIMIFWNYDFSPVKGAADALGRMVHFDESGQAWLHDLGDVVENFEGLAEFAVTKELFGDGVPVRSMRVECTLEQQPNPDSRITLSATRDALGMREVAVDWQLVPEDKRGAAEILHLLGREIGRAGFGRFKPMLTEGGSWPHGFAGNEHQMGATRMHDDPKHGVVDADCRVHGMGNLYVAGSSVFPTGGANNPTLTIVALALRLADRIKGQLA